MKKQCFFEFPLFLITAMESVSVINRTCITATNHVAMIMELGETPVPLFMREFGGYITDIPNNAMMKVDGIVTRSEVSMTKRPKIPRDRALPAPGELEVLQSLLDTRNVVKGFDELASPRHAASWLSRWRLMPATAELAEADVERIIHVRDGLRALLRTHSGAALDDAALERLDEATVGARVEIRFDREGVARFEPASQSLADAIGVLLAIVVNAQKEGRWHRLKVCANPECQKSFYDFAPGAKGKWCCLRCGDLIRARAYRQGQKYQRLRR